MRSVIAHYHTYKNSGTSFDALLSENYDSNHLTFDGPFPYMVINQDELQKVINNHPDHIAFSSHQIRLPAPANALLRVIPAAFIRHPYLRIKSVYEFAQKHNNGNPADDWAKSHDLNGWLHKHREHRRMININNSQVEIYGGRYGGPAHMIASGDSDLGFYAIGDIVQAKRNLLATPLLARTEQFDGDVAQFSTILKQYNLTFSFCAGVANNVTDSNHKMPIDDRIKAIIDLLDDSNQRWLAAANAHDIELYEFASELINFRKKHPEHALI